MGDQMTNNVPDSKVHGANMVPIWGRQDPGGPPVGPMNLTIWGKLICREWSWEYVSYICRYIIAQYFDIG